MARYLRTGRTTTSPSSIDGNLRVSEIWDSQEQFEAFGERLMPILEQVGIDPGQPEIHEVHNVIKR